jgi:hypothetical protein
VGYQDQIFMVGAEFVGACTGSKAPRMEWHPRRSSRMYLGSHDTGRVITCFSEVVYYSAAAINQSFLQVRAVKMDLGHVQPPTK